MRYTFEQIVPILNRVEKPGRYTGGEKNSVQPKDGDFRFALGYPDLYEIGMANQGIQILYSRLNETKGLSCERFYAPGKDLFECLKQSGLNLFTLETFTPLNEMEAVGFNLSHELLYTNMLYILESAGIAIFSRERLESDPIIIAGGEAVSNPAPVSLFVDCFFAGEGEEGIIEIAESLKSNRNLNRLEKLKALSLIEGVMVPSLYKTAINGDGMVIFEGPRVNKRNISGQSLRNPLKPVIPSVRTSQERAVIEITRGCDNLCKFCHAGYYTLPLRQCSVEKTAQETFEVLENTGYNGVTFTSLSISDYAQLIPLLNRVLPDLNRKGVNVNLPSMKVDKGTLPIITTISGVKQVNLTFAVEAAHTEIRKLIHKRVHVDELLEIVRYVFENGWKTIKLYFMLGLPGYKEYDEAQSIIDLLKKIFDIGRGKKSINATVSPFIPKPHTPLDMNDMATAEYFNSVVDKLKKALPRKIAVKNHNIDSSIVEGFLARGDIECGRALHEAYTAGAVFDSWSEHFNSNAWLPVVEKYMHRADYFCERTDENQSWSVILTGAEKLVSAKRDTVLSEEDLGRKRMRHEVPFDYESINRSMEDFEKSYEKLLSVRIVFSKKGRARYISHLDLVEIIKRAFNIAKLPICYSRGFNKRAHIGGGFPLPLGIDSECEVFDCDLYSEMPVGLEDVIGSNLPEGVELVKIYPHNGDTIALHKNSVSSYRICGNSNIIEKIEKAIDSDITLTKKTKKGVTEIKAADSVHSVQRGDNNITLFLYTGSTNALRIDALMRAFVNDDEYNSLVITKIAIYNDENGLTNLL